MEERKRSERKIAPKLVPKKKTDEVIPVIKKTVTKKKVEAIPTLSDISPFIVSDDTSEVKPKPKPSLDKYIRVAEDVKLDERKVISDKISKGEISFAYYAIDNDKGYHYYLIIK